MWALREVKDDAMGAHQAHSPQQFETYFGVVSFTGSCDLVSVGSTVFCHACELPQYHALRSVLT